PGRDGPGAPRGPRPAPPRPPLLPRGEQQGGRLRGGADRRRRRGRVPDREGPLRDRGPPRWPGGKARSAMSRFDRQERITGWDQEALARARVVVYGRDWLGAWAVWALSSLGVGTIA